MIEVFVGLDVLEHVGVAAVGPNFGDVGGAEESDERSVESDGDVERCGIVGDDAVGELDERHEPADGGLADAVDDARLAGGEIEERRALGALVSGTDEHDAMIVRVEQGAGDFGESVGGPAFAGPGAGGGEQGVVASREFWIGGEGVCVFGGRVEAEIGGGGDAGGGEEIEHSIDGVSRGDAVAFVETEPAELAGVGEADAALSAGPEGEESAASEALGVDDEVVLGCAE